ncbi:MAG: bifunctional oligoribonuclease/PAP phosphatase NrnA [Clostridia bacterium]
MTINFETVLEELKSHDDILILTHASPDGDTLGSGFALLHALRAMGKRVKLKNNDELPKKFAYLYEGVQMPEFDEKYIVTVDVADFKLLGNDFRNIYGDKVDLRIDHHSSSADFAKMSYIEADSASNCEIIFNVIEGLGVTITKEISDCIYTGCCTDTGCFRYSNVTVRTHMIAAKLIEYGADYAGINVKMFETKSKNVLMLEKVSLESLEMFSEEKVAFITITQKMLNETSTDESDCDAICALTRQIEGVKVGVTFKEKKDGTIGISVRTYEPYDASAICKALGGGGHNRAAGCKFSCGMDEAKRRTLEQIAMILAK